MKVTYDLATPEMGQRIWPARGRSGYVPIKAPSGIAPIHGRVRPMPAVESDSPVVISRLERAMNSSPADFRSVESLARELGISTTEVRLAMNHLGNLVRPPIGAKGRSNNLFRLTSRGLTTKEKWLRIRAYAGRTAT